MFLKAKEWTLRKEVTPKLARKRKSEHANIVVEGNERYQNH